MTWQPIDTVPRNGADVLLYDGECIMIGRWVVEPRPAWMAPITRLRQNFRVHGDEYEVGPYEFGDPTHWTLLPDKPEAAA